MVSKLFPTIRLSDVTNVQSELKNIPSSETSVILRYDQILLKTPVNLSKKNHNRDQVLMGGLDRCIDRYIGWYIGRYSTDTRSSTGGVSTDSPLNVGRRIDHDTISVNYRLYIGRLSVKSRSILDRYIDRVSTNARTPVKKMRSSAACIFCRLRVADRNDLFNRIEVE